MVQALTMKNYLGSNKMLCTYCILYLIMKEYLNLGYVYQEFAC
jgi:hypothetical protein